MIYIQGCRIRRTPYVYVILYITYAYVYARGGIPPRAYIFGGRAGGLERNRSEQNGTQRNRNGSRHSTGRLGFLHRRSGSTGRFALSALLYRRCGGQKNWAVGLFALYAPELIKTKSGAGALRGGGHRGSVMFVATCSVLSCSVLFQLRPRSVRIYTQTLI